MKLSRKEILFNNFFSYVNDNNFPISKVETLLDREYYKLCKKNEELIESILIYLKWNRNMSQVSETDYKYAKELLINNGLLNELYKGIS